MKSSLSNFGLAFLLTLSTCPAQAQANLGTSFGFSSESPPVLWPKGFSLEALRPDRLYPNGPEFGLGNTSGGFGSSGTGKVSGVGLAERSVGFLAAEELLRPSIVPRLLDAFNAEQSRSNTLLSVVLGSSFRQLIQAGTVSSFSSDSFNSTFSGSSNSVSSAPDSSLVDSVLNDRPLGSDQILNSPLSPASRP